MDSNHRSRAGAVWMGLDQVEHPTGEPDEREHPNAAGDRGFVAVYRFPRNRGREKRRGRAAASAARRVPYNVSR
jgi:hypothetical protein